MEKYKQKIDKGRPIAGKTYLLIGKGDKPSIARGNTWAESEVKEKPSGSFKEESAEKDYPEGTINVLLYQLRSMGVDLYGKKLVKIDENTLRIADFKRKQNVDIHYNRGTDLYDITIRKHVTAYLIKGEKPPAPKVFNGVFVENLPDFINKSWGDI